MSHSLATVSKNSHCLARKNITEKNLSPKHVGKFWDKVGSAAWLEGLLGKIKKQA
jgi:hypothetical protein